MVPKAPSIFVKNKTNACPVLGGREEGGRVGGVMGSRRGSGRVDD